MKPYLDDGDVRLILGDCVEVMAGLEAESVDAVVTDPPYGLEFMGKEWDRFAGAVSDRDFKGFVLSQQRTRNVKCPECGRWAYDHPGRLCECGGIRRAQGTTYQSWCQIWATQALRVLRPGGHLLAFGGTRTFHRLTCAIEDAGFEIRDSVLELEGQSAVAAAFVASLNDEQRGALSKLLGDGHLVWEYGSGFPKSLDVSKAIDRAAGAEREVVGKYQYPPDHPRPPINQGGDSGSAIWGGSEWNGAITAPATPEAERWQGWGTALKPAWEPIILARKPLAGTVAGNVLAHGTGALNVDGCRVAATDKTPFPVGYDSNRNGAAYGEWASVRSDDPAPAGRWPSNVVLSHTPECREVGTRKVKGSHGYGSRYNRADLMGYGGTNRDFETQGHVDPDGTETVAAWECSPDCPVRMLDEEVGERRSGSRAAGDYGRLGYQGWDAGPMPAVDGDSGGVSRFFYTSKASTAERDSTSHPTTKPLALMRWLVRLVTPPGGLVLDCFAGSGTTLLAAREEGFRAIGIEREREYCEMAAHRLRQLSLFSEA